MKEIPKLLSERKKTNKHNGGQNVEYELLQISQYRNRPSGLL